MEFVTGMLQEVHVCLLCAKVFIHSQQLKRPEAVLLARASKGLE